MSLEVVLSCPLGHTCEVAKDGKIHRCAWYIRLAGENPQTGEVADEWGCAMGWLPILLVENARQGKSTAAAVESFRNETVKQQTVQTVLLQSLPVLKEIE